MKNRRSILYSLVAATLALMFQCSYIQQREQQLRGDYELVEVMVAKKNIPKDWKLDETMVAFQQVPKKFVQPKALRKIDEILGQISGSTIFSGEQILSTKLLSIEDAGLAFKIPKGYRAFTLSVDEINGVGGHVRPGNYIDVMGIFDFGDERRQDQRAVTLLQNVYVLAAGADLGQAVPVNLSGRDEGMIEAENARGLARDAIYRSVTIMLSPAEAQKVMLAQEAGALTLTLRSLWEGNTDVELEKIDIHKAIGIPEKLLRTARPRYIEIQAGRY
jgi:pilus assembly protein CpaB